MTDNNKTAFRLAREKAGLTRRECAALLDITDSTIQKYEQTGLNDNNRRIPGALMLDVLDWYARKVPPHLPGQPDKKEKPKRMTINDVLALHVSTKKKLLRSVVEYRSGADSINTVYMGGMAIAGLTRHLGGEYGKDNLGKLISWATKEKIDKAIKEYWSYIDYMLLHPVKKCPACGQIKPDG